MQTTQMDPRLDDEYNKKADELDAIFNASMSAVYSAEVIRNNTGKVTNIKFLRVNNQFLKMHSFTREHIINNLILNISPKTAYTSFLDFVDRVDSSGEPLQNELHYPDVDKWYEFSMVKLGRNMICVTYNDITQQKQNLLRIQQQKTLLDNILLHSASGISVTEAIRDEHKKIVNWKTILANEAAAKFLGLPLEQLLKLTTLEIAPDLMNSPTALAAIETLQTGQPFTHQVHIEPLKVWIEISVSRLDNDHLINIFTNITNSKEAQLKMEDLTVRLKTVFNEAQAGMFIFRPEKNEAGEVTDFRFVLVNPTLAAYVGQKPEALEGDLGSKWFPGYMENGVFDMYRQTHISGISARREVHYNVDCLDIYLDLQCVSLGDDVLVTFTDHTPLRRTQHQLERSVEELKRSNASLEEFTRAASHDLKEPIRKIHFFVDMLKRMLSSSLTNDQQQLFGRLENATERMRLLIDDLLEYSHASLNTLAREEIDLNQKLKLVLDDLELAVKEKKAKVVVGQLPAIKGHRRQIQQLFQNLISNSLKYSKAGIIPEITISATVVTGRSSGVPLPAESLNRKFHCIQISDNGIGFEQEHADRIFNAFTRLHSKDEYMGTGIGLSIVRKVVENHNGYISAKGEPGRGSVFTVLLPTQ